ncbi:MAG: uracil-DNA glycosylase [Phycisphaerales bacterium]|nr:uracil-DNA glycosylase [Phycisphaerales bacterium]
MLVAGEIADAVAQFFATDRYFGLSELPVPRAVLAAARRTPARANAGSAATSNAVAPTDKAGRLEVLDLEQVKGCRKCRLCEGRNNTVFGVGSAEARLVFVGEGPGFEEDRQGIPFVGKAGQLLTRMIIAMGLRRDDVYICNIVKCRPPNNRDPAADEIMACSPYLYEQLRVIEPEIIVALGSPASKTLLDTTTGISRLRGQFHDFKLRDPLGDVRTIPLMPTYHPAYLLRSPNEKVKAWKDLQMVMARLGLPLPQGG